MPLRGRQWLPREIALLLFEHGWTHVDNLTVMTAILRAESAFYEQAWHWNNPADGGDGSTDWGLFQLNDGNRGGISPDRDGNPQKGGKLTLLDVKGFRDRVAWSPSDAAQQARDLYERRSFQPWAAYGNDSYKQFIGEAAHGVMNMIRVLHHLDPL